MSYPYSLVLSFRFCSCFTRAAQWYSVSSSQRSALALLHFFLFSYYLCLLLLPEMVHANVADLFYLCIRQTSILLALWHPAVPAHNIVSLRNLQTRSSYANLHDSNPPQFKFVNRTSNITNDFQRLTQNSSKRQFVESSLIFEDKKDAIKCKNLSSG